MLTSEKPAASGPPRSAPTVPSLIPPGALIFAPARAGLTACLSTLAQPRQRHIHRHLKHAGHRRDFLTHSRSLTDKNGNNDIGAPYYHPLEHSPDFGVKPQSPGADGEVERFGHAGIIHA